MAAQRVGFGVEIPSYFRLRKKLSLISCSAFERIGEPILNIARVAVVFQRVLVLSARWPMI